MQFSMQLKKYALNSKAIHWFLYFSFTLLIEIMLPHLEIVFKGIIFSNFKVHCQMGAPDLLNPSFIGYLDKLQFFLYYK